MNISKQNSKMMNMSKNFRFSDVFINISIPTFLLLLSLLLLNNL